MIETAREEGAFQEFCYEELPDAPLPEPPAYDPDLMTDPEHQTRSIDTGSSRGVAYTRGAVKVPARDSETLRAHLRWIAWGLVEGLTDMAVAKRFSNEGETLGVSRAIEGSAVAALYRAGGLATVMGLHRN